MPNEQMTTDPFDLPLDEYLSITAEPETFVTEQERFTIGSEEEALWAMRKLAQSQRRIDEVKRLAQIEIDRINVWIEHNTSDNQRQVSFYETALSDYLISVRENSADGRKKLDFPDGVVSSRVTPSKVEVADLESFVRWAEENGHSDWVRVKREADVSTIKKVVDFSGESVIDPRTGLTVSGLNHVEGGISVTVKVAE